MIKFFRNIRQNMIKETPTTGRASNVSKYLLYAIGEIVLVVIGIPIACTFPRPLKGSPYLILCHY
jgi:hypothetical protein